MAEEQKDEGVPKTPTGQPEQEESKITPEAGAALIDGIVKAIDSIGKQYLEYKRESNRINAVAVVLALVVIAVVFAVIISNKVSGEAAGFLLGSIVTGTFTVLADIWRRQR
jgi:hypothetical protein